MATSEQAAGGGPPSPERGRPPLAEGALPMGASSPERGRPPLAEGAAAQKHQAAVELFVTTLYRSARTAGLFKPGHPNVLQLAQRMHAVLLSTLGREPTLTLDIKAKEVLIDETLLSATEEIRGFASSLHTLGVGQLLFTNRLTPEGLLELFRVLLLKADEKNSLTDLQKAVQAARIDGLQMMFILSFVVTGEEEQKQKPGQLSEDQVAAFTAAGTLPDFLALLQHQNEKLAGKEAEKVSDLLDSLRYRDLTLEKFTEGFPWASYDSRIRARFETLAGGLRWTPKARPGGQGAAVLAARPSPSREEGGGQGARGRSLADLAAWTLLFEERDLAALQDHRGLDGEEALRHSLRKVHDLLDRPAVSAQLKHAVTAYARLLGELGRAGDVPRLLAEHARWKAMAEDKRLSGGLFETLHKRVRDAAANPSVAAQLVSFLEKAESAEISGLKEFILFIGPAMVPLLLEQMRELADKARRRKLCSVLASVCAKTGSKPLLDRLSEEDWFIVSNVAYILGEMGDPADLAKLPPLLKHGHRKVREAAVRVLVKSGGPEALESLATFVETASDAEGSEAEALTALIALSQARHPGLDKRLIVSFGRTQDYDIQVGIATALGRIAESPEVIPFLVEKARRGWYEVLTGSNQELHEAALQSLDRLRRDGKA